jgi:hypothetical protein
MDRIYLKSEIYDQPQLQRKSGVKMKILGGWMQNTDLDTGGSKKARSLARSTAQKSSSEGSAFLAGFGL